MARVLIACEYSGVMRQAFTELGHFAVSADLLPTELHGYHYQGNVLDLLTPGDWDLMIAHPPCTYLSYAGLRHWNAPGRSDNRDAAVKLFMSLYNAPIPHICIENPVGLMNSVFRKPDQVIHPYYFGDGEMKRTCLWLKDLPPLSTTMPKSVLLKNKPAPIGADYRGRNLYWTDLWRNSPKSQRGHFRSRTFPGIAAACATQWSAFLAALVV